MWLYKGKQINSIEDLPEGTFGFVYRVIHEPTGKIYIGKKVLQFNRKTKLTKRDLALYEGQSGRKPSFKRVVKESDWKTYYGSHKEILALIKDGKEDDFKREILTCVTTKKLLTYEETKALFLYEVLVKPDEYFNDNILGKFFRKDFD